MLKFCCVDCDTERPIEAFSVYASGQICSYCKDCRKVRNRAYYVANRQRLLADQRVRDAETKAAADRARKWREANPDRRRAHGLRGAHVRRVRLAEGDVREVSDLDWHRLLRRHGGMCAYCKVRPATERDHIIPIARGGRHAIGNLLPACGPCNRNKSAKLLVEWRAA